MPPRIDKQTVPEYTVAVWERGVFMGEGKETAEIKSLDALLKMNLAIPDYQRPYKWTKKNVADLLEDIGRALEQGGKARRSGDGAFKYRIGTVILHWNSKDKVYDVVDGQQRIISLLLIRRCLASSKGPGSFIKVNLSNRQTQANLAANYAFIKDWFKLKRESRDTFLASFSDLLEVVVITVEKTSEAFQLFDSQNARGRELDPHDLLKAYHLREMNGYLFEMQRAVTKWEAVPPAAIKELFGKYLFPIIKWTGRDKSIPFSAREIDTFKGVPGGSAYAYAARTRKAMPAFQITEPFIAGGDFFSMVDHYLALLAYLREALREDAGRFSALCAVLENGAWLRSVGFQYAKALFECALLCYYDRFRNLDEQAVKKLFTWAFMLRVDMESLGFDSVNRYAIGLEGAYTNTYPVFSIIHRARVHTTISNLTVYVARDPDAAKSPKWDELYCQLKQINQVRVDAYGNGS